MRILLLAGSLLAALALSAAAPGATPATELRVTFWPDGREDGASTAWTLRCGPNGGTHPLRARACGLLARADRPFRPVARDEACIQIYGGADEALVTGTLRGSRVWARFSLRDGCQIARWNRLVPLLPAPGA